jgi:hypothetical protein
MEPVTSPAIQPSLPDSPFIQFCADARPRWPQNRRCRDPCCMLAADQSSEIAHSIHRRWAKGKALPRNDVEQRDQARSFLTVDSVRPAHAIRASALDQEVVVVVSRTTDHRLCVGTRADGA